MKKSFFLKTILLGFAMLSLSGCGGETSSSESTSTSGSIVSTSVSSSSGSKITNNHKPGDNITITKDNFFNYFDYHSYGSIYNYFGAKYNLEAEIKIIERLEYYCPLLDDRLETYAERIFSSSTVSGEEYKKGTSSNFVETSYVNHFVEPTEWESKSYDRHIYNCEFDFVKLNGILTLGTEFYNPIIINLDNTNYSQYMDCYFSRKDYEGNKTIVESQIHSLDGAYSIFIENLKADFEFIAFDQNYSKVKTVEFSVTDICNHFLQFDKAAHYVINLKNISGLLYLAGCIDAR